MATPYYIEKHLLPAKMVIIKYLGTLRLFAVSVISRIPAFIYRPLFTVLLILVSVSPRQSFPASPRKNYSLLTVHCTVLALVSASPPLRVPASVFSRVPASPQAARGSLAAGLRLVETVGRLIQSNLRDVTLDRWGPAGGTLQLNRLLSGGDSETRWSLRPDRHKGVNRRQKVFPGLAVRVEIPPVLIRCPFCTERVLSYPVIAQS